MSPFLAHSANSEGRPQPLVEHLRNVAELAAGFAAPLGARETARWAGLWHDLGKFHSDFQEYLSAPDGRRGPDHSSAGALLAWRFLQPLAFLIAGHHGGLPDRAGLRTRLREKRSSAAIQEALAIARRELAADWPAGPLMDCWPEWLREPACGSTEGPTRLATDLFLRLLFSALVDADFLDTEGHFRPERGAARGKAPGLEELWQRFRTYHRKLAAGARENRLNDLRSQIFDACVEAAELPPGLFRLTVPTGGGKTLSGMAFALRHALRHGLSRVVVAIPYTSIIEQTADTYREAFGGDGVLEHHSAVAPPEAESPVTPSQLWPRLASENWDAPVVVTTTVQLFESLFSNRPSACRKLHRLAGSVIVLDEVQTLPLRLFGPILSVLTGLEERYRVTVVFCTATQPALARGPYAEPLRTAREIVPEPGRFFAELRRVRYELPCRDGRWSWERVASELRSSEQALAVVNTKRDALALLDAVGDSGTLHLSTRLCGAHRREVLRRVRAALKTDAPCRLVSTQVIEAGVDVDFPLVLRAAGPLDRIVQAAGRCNREGGLGTEGGRVVVFEPEEGGMPRGDYRTASQTAVLFLREHADLHAPETHRAYFEELTRITDVDRDDIDGKRSRLEFRSVSEVFRLIDYNQTPVVVSYPPDGDRVEKLLAAARKAAEGPRAVLRRLQPYMVNLFEADFQTAGREGMVEEVVPGLWRWLGRYDEVRGLVNEGPAPEDLVI